MVDTLVEMAEAGRSIDNDCCVYEVEKVLNRRKNRYGKIQYLVRWKDFPSDADSWEPLSNLDNCQQHVEEFNERLFDSKGSHVSITKDSGISGNMADRKLSSSRTIKKGTETNLSKNYNDLNHRKNTRRPQKEECQTNITLNNGHGPKRKRRDSSTSLFDGESGRYMLANDFSNASSPNSITIKREKQNRSYSVSTNQVTNSQGAVSDVARPIKRQRCLSLHSCDETFYRDDQRPVSSIHTPMNLPFSNNLIKKQLSPVVKLHDIKSKSTMQAHSRYNGVKTLRAHPKSDEETTEDHKDWRVSLRQTECLYRFKEIVVRKSAGYTQVWFFTSSTVRNSLNPKVFNELTTVLMNSKKDNSSVLLLHGTGNIFCSGVDLRYLAHRSNESRRTAARHMAQALRRFIDALINFPKIIVAAVNGAATGLGAAILPLCDIVYASDKAIFSTPYASLAQVPEGCSSLTFPTIMGHALANEMLIGGRKLTALEAYACGLVSHVFWPTSLMQEVIPRVQSIAVNSSKAMQMSKALIRNRSCAKMENANENECSMLTECWSSLDGYKARQSYIEKNREIFI